MNLETIIGLEVHIQLKTKSKLFCGCASQFGKPANTLTCPVCTGQPGVLPVLNRQALALAIKAGIALNCRVAHLTKFDRKNYFYPDLPKGYQISQYDMPVADSGHIHIHVSEGRGKKIGILRAHLEEDAGKDLHPEGTEFSLVDLNRAGVPLLEIVSAPEISSPKEAYAYLTELKKIMQYIGVSDCDMEKGSLRCDANLSLRPSGSEEFGVKTEMKNLNSFRNVEKALSYEEERQSKILATGGKVIHETRMWREEEQRTDVMRSKEEAHDYRYFPEPDLPPFEITRDLVERLKESLPELPHDRKERFKKDYKFSEYDASVLTAEREIADFFEACTQICKDPKEVSNWIQSVIMKELNERNMKMNDLDISPQPVASLISMMKEGKLSRQAAKKVVPVLIDKGGDPDQIVRDMGLEQVSDTSLLESIVDDVISQHPSMVQEFQAGKEATLNALIGQVMKTSKGKANPQRVRELLIEKIRGGSIQ